LGGKRVKIETYHLDDEWVHASAISLISKEVEKVKFDTHRDSYLSLLTFKIK